MSSSVARLPTFPPPQSFGAAAGTPAMKGPRMVDLYESYFKVVLAETEEQRNAAFRLRYDVYCIEHPFEDPSVNPGSMERDAFDERALHAILIYRQDNAVIGTVRLLLPDGAENGAALP